MQRLRRNVLTKPPLALSMSTSKTKMNKYSRLRIPHSQLGKIGLLRDNQGPAAGARFQILGRALASSLTVGCPDLRLTQPSTFELIERSLKILDAPRNNIQI